MDRAEWPWGAAAAFGAQFEGDAAGLPLPCTRVDGLEPVPMKGPQARRQAIFLRATEPRAALTVQLTMVAAVCWLAAKSLIWLDAAHRTVQQMIISCTVERERKDRRKTAAVRGKCFQRFII